MIKDFSSWIEYDGASEGSGRSEKIWLVNPSNGDVGLFKFTKSEYTTEHLSEKIATEIAQLINIKCMKVDIGIYDSKVGSLSYRINKKDENLIEGIRLINRYYPS
ncbi:MAG: protein kinase, partial [Christensenellales bacterium]